MGGQHDGLFLSGSPPVFTFVYTYVFFLWQINSAAAVHNNIRLSFSHQRNQLYDHRDVLRSPRTSVCWDVSTAAAVTSDATDPGRTYRRFCIIVVIVVGCCWRRNHWLRNAGYVAAIWNQRLFCLCIVVILCYRLLSYSLLNIAETQPTGKMIVTLRLCLYLPETGVAGVMLDLDRLWIVCRLMFDACDPSSSFLWRSTTPAYLRRSGSNSDGCCAARNP